MITVHHDRVARTQRTRWWALPSAVVAPIAMIGGWTLAAALQPPGYSSVGETISALAGDAATDRWVMTLGLAAVGACHLVTAAGLGAARWPGRVLLGLGGAATLAVAANPLPAAGSSTAHTASATVAFIALSLWPAAAGRGGVGWSLRPSTSAVATVVLVALLLLFRLTSDGDSIGLTERLLAGAQSLWPLVVVVGSLRNQRA